MEGTDFNEMTYLDEDKVEAIGFRLYAEGYLVHPMDKEIEKGPKKEVQKKKTSKSEKTGDKWKNDKKEKESTLGKIEKLKKEVEKNSKKDKVEKSIER